MDRAALYQLMAFKWLETAEQVEHRSLQRCYAKRALTYQAMAAAYARKVEPQAIPLHCLVMPPKLPPM
jgi:hypothetical protein